MSRRGLLAGSLTAATAAGLTAPGAAPAAAALIAAEQRVVRRGRAIAVADKGRRIVVAHDQRRTIAVGRRLVNVGGEPVDVAVAPDGRRAAVTTGFWDRPGLAVVDLRTERVRARVDVGPAPHSVAFTRAGERILVTGGEQEGGVWIVRGARVVAHAAVGICPRAIVTAPGDRAWIAVAGDDAVVLIAARTGRVLRTIRTPPLPERLAISPDGGRLLIAHAGLEADRVSELDVETRRVVRHRVGRLPSAVAWTRTGKRLVALGGAGQVVVIGGRRQAVGGAPRGLAVAGRRAYTVDGLSGEIAWVRA